MIIPRSKYDRCPDCGLKIRCRDLESHKNGFHHKRRKATLEAQGKGRTKQAKQLQY